MVAWYALGGIAPMLDMNRAGCRVRAWGLGRADGGYVAIEDAGVMVPTLRYAVTWTAEIRRIEIDPSSHVATRAQLSFLRDMVEPEIARLTCEALDAQFPGRVTDRAEVEASR